MSTEPCNDKHGGFFCAKPAGHDDGEHESCGGRRWARAMDADLTCQECDGTGARGPDPFGCRACHGTGKRLPTLAEWDALRAERNELRERLTTLTSPDTAIARAARDCTCSTRITTHEGHLVHADDCTQAPVLCPTCQGIPPDDLGYQDTCPTCHGEHTLT